MISTTSRLRAPARRPVCDERGAVTAELALVLPLLVAVTIGLVWLLAVGADQLRAVDAARETARALARGDTTAAAVAVGLAVAPDGSRIAFMGKEGRVGADIYVVGSGGGDPLNLTNNPAHDSGPVFSPDGSMIAFVSGRDTNHEIYRVSADGAGLVNLTQNGASDEQPAWSPDGRRLLFVSDRNQKAEIYVMNADGSEQASLTSN